MAASDLTPETLKSLYLGMVRVRMVEETIANFYREQEMRCPVHLSIGQEAPAVGVCKALAKTDYVLSSHRCHAHYLAKGGALKPMIAELYGKETGCCQGKGGSMHLVDLKAGFLGAAPIVGSTIPIAVGVAMGTVMKGKDNVTVAFFGDGATEEGVFHESLNFAVLKNLPVLFVCENNFYSVYSPLSVRQPAGLEIASLARAHGVESFQVDGNDVAKVYEITKSAVERVRKTKAPMFLELTTYRWREHCGPNYDNNIGYRSEVEFKEWQEHCPIAAVEKNEEIISLFDTDEIASEKAKIIAEIDDAFQFAKASKFPEQKTMFEGVFAA
jgi:pyruvate dehydrogenase E1 component alpha subunit